MKNKIIALLMVMTLLFSAISLTLTTSAITFSDDKLSGWVSQSEAADWISANYETGSSVTNNEYSFAFVGDTQMVTYGDLKNGTKNLEAMYGWIADNAASKNIAHVFALGDMTEFSYHNDEAISASQTYKTGTAEWDIVKAATNKLKGVVPYSVVRGNHDDYQIDTYYGNDSTYTSQFGGFYRPNSGRYGTNSITNSWRLFEVHDDKYLFMTIDFNAAQGVIKWANDVITAHPDRKVIITTHGYLDGDGTLQSMTKDTQSYKEKFYVDGQVLWNEVVSQHENIIMVVSGHYHTDEIVYNFAEGKNGNKVLQVLMTADATKKVYTGKICLMHFSENGQKITFEYYSPLLNMHKKDNSDVVYLDDRVAEYKGNIDIAGLDSYGQDNVYVTSSSTVAPVLDGVISNGEYKTKRVIPQTNAPSGTYESDLTEYFAFDDNYIYYAFSVKMTNNQQVQFQFTNQLNYKTATEFNKNHYSRNVIRFKVNDDNSLSETAIVPRSDMPTAVWNQDVFVKATRNKSTYVNTYELKLSRNFFKLNNIDDTKFGYIIYLGLDSTSTAVWHYWMVPDSAKWALNVYPTWTYNYIRFASPIETRNAASVRISSTHTGLRFKTVIENNFLNKLSSTYPTATISVGTLIAPADILGANKLTHAFGTYIDIPATYNKPFASDAETKTYAGSITNIKEGNLDRDFVGVGYIKVSVPGSEPIYYYSDAACVRNVSMVAAKALADVQETQAGEYKYLVDSSDAYAAQYSPYTAAQRVILNSLIRKTGIKDPFDFDIF